MTIRLLYTYLDHDIRQFTTRCAEARAKEPDTRDLAQLGEGQSDQELIMRLVVTGVAGLKRVLSGKLIHGSKDSDDILPSVGKTVGERPKRDSWDFRLKDTEVDGEALAWIMHWFVVRYALAEWCRMFAPDELNSIKSAVRESENEIDELLSDTAMPVKDRIAKSTEDWPAEIVYTYTPDT